MVGKVDDRRVFDRFTARFPTKFKDSRQEYGTDVFLRDLSADGLRIASRERMFLKEKVDLLVNLPDGSTPVNLRGRVKWVREGRRSSWDIGVQLDGVRLMKTQRIFKYCL